MKPQSILVHFGELSTKGNNRKQFIKALGKNIASSLSRFPTAKVAIHRDHINVMLNEEDHEEVLSRLGNIAGIQRLSLCYVCEKDYAKIAETAIKIMEDEEGKTFKVKAHRADKSFPMPSMELAARIGGAILSQKRGWTVDVHEPDVTLKIDVNPEGVYLYCHDVLGIGGYPLGMNGKVTMLLSGGIDSPVAAFSLIRRGIRVDCLHFASPPYTSDAVLDKLTDILTELNAYQDKIALEVIPFTKIQSAIYEYVAEPYCITIMRRMMMRIAAKCKEKNHSLGIATGESIGQVASQTLESLNVINAVTNYPVIRPLATSDKLTIINTAKKINTYDISIRPYEDCCTIFAPRNPVTKPTLKDAEYYESKFDWAPLIEEAVANSYWIVVKGGKAFKKEEGGSR